MCNSVQVGVLKQTHRVRDWDEGSHSSWLEQQLVARSWSQRPEPRVTGRVRSQASELRM